MTYNIFYFDWIIYCSCCINRSRNNTNKLKHTTTNKGTKPVTVTYEGKTTTFNITIKNGVKNINITAPTKTEYEHGDTLDFTGGKIEVKYADSTTSNVQITNAMVTETQQEQQ